MNRYESVILVKPTLNDEELNGVKNKFFSLVKDSGGKILLNEEEYTFVLKKTAYEVRKFNKANYLVFQFEAEPAVLTELERVYRITDEIIKYMTVKIDKDTKLISKFPEDVKESRRNYKKDIKEEKEAEDEVKSKEQNETETENKNKIEE